MHRQKHRQIIVEVQVKAEVHQAIVVQAQVVHVVLVAHQEVVVVEVEVLQVEVEVQVVEDNYSLRYGFISRTGSFSGISGRPVPCIL